MCFMLLPKKFPGKARLGNIFFTRNRAHAGIERMALEKLQIRCQFKFSFSAVEM